MENDNYRVVKDPTVWGLQMTVNELALEGWEPQGALVIDPDGNYIQTMIKKEKPVLTEETNQ